MASGGLPVIEEYARHRQRDGRGSAAVRLSAASDELVCAWITHLAAAGQNEPTRIVRRQTLRQIARGIPYPHLLAIEDPATLRAELALTGQRWNSVRLHAGIGYVTPDDEHQGRGEAIRKACKAGLEQARNRRFAWHHQQRNNQPTQDPGNFG